jgi:hypothetical protein
MSLNDYRPTPFWFLNHKLEKDEILRQLQMMQNAGVSGFFMHPRAGLKTPYMSGEWLDIIEFIVNEAEKLGLKAWLYDEDPFPSGAVGGRIFFDHPEFAARGIKFFELRPDKAGIVNAPLGKGIVLNAIALRIDDAGKIIEKIDIKDKIGVLRSNFFKSEWNNSYYAQITGKEKYPHYRSETFYPHLQLYTRLPDGNWQVFVNTAEIAGGSKYEFLPDNLNRECVNYFITHTHEKYKDKIGNKFGTVIPGIFTDEPAVGAPVPWTGELESVFFKTHNYSIQGNYHHLFKNLDECSRTVRKDYWETVYKLFSENYFGQIKDWCKNNSLELCGHCIGEEDPLGTTGGSNTFGLQNFMDIPGFDHITHKIPDGTFCSLSLGGKLIASTALQQGKKQVLSECFGCNPFNFGPEGMRKIANWLFSLGVNWLIPHGFFYSYDGYRKSDAGRSFFFQHEDFAKFKEFADYAERTGQKLGEAESCNHVCVIFPVSVFRSLLPAEKELAEKIRENLFNCVQFLLDKQIQFDLADEETLLKSELGCGVIKCGRQSYDSIVMPELEGLETTEIKSVINKFKGLIPYIEYPSGISKLPPLAGMIEFNSNVSNLISTVKKNADGTLLYIFNNAPEPQTIRVKYKKHCKGCYLIELNSGCHYELPKAKSNYQFVIGGFEAVIIEFRTHKLTCPAYTIPKGLPVKEYNFEKNPQWDYIPPGQDWLAALSCWDIVITGDEINKSVQNHLFCLCRDLAGTELSHITSRISRPIFDTVPELEWHYPLEMKFSAKFELSQESTAKDLLLVFENDTFSGKCRIFINNKKLDGRLIKRQRLYDPMNKVIAINQYCHAGENIISILWEKAGEFDGLRSSIYIKQL